MTNFQSPKPNMEKEFDIHKRIFSFVVRVLNLTKVLPKTPQNLVVINQISRSVTSIGANDREADGCSTRRAFNNCFTTVKKETKETNYWLAVIYETNLGFQKRMEPLIQEGKEIEAIVSSILEKTRKS